MRQSGIEEIKSDYSDFCLLRLLSKVVKQGKDMKFLFETLDEDKSGQSKPIERNRLVDFEEFYEGIKQHFGIYICREEFEQFFYSVDTDLSSMK